MCLAQWHDAVTPVRHETVALWSRVRSVWIQNAVKANSLELGLAGDQVGPGTGPDFLAKHKSGSIDFVESLSENMGIYMEFRKVWPFKCQNSENGTFMILSFFKKKRGFIPGGAEKGGYSGAHPYYVIHRELTPPPPRECRKGRSKVMQTVALQCLLKVKQDLC